MSSMLVVGSIAIDTIHNHLGVHERVIGGSAIFGALAGALFVPVSIVGVVGEDFPLSAIQLLQSKGINTGSIEWAKGKTFHWEGRYSRDLTHRESIRTELNVFAEFQPKIPPALRDTPYVMLGNIHPNLQIEVLEQMARPKLVVADTMNFWITGTPTELARMLARIDVLVINEEEARLLAGVHNIPRAAKILQAMGPRIVVIKRGEYGALLFENGTVFSAPAYPVEDVVDPTGAGDSFAGAMLGALASEDRVDGASLRRAVIYGSVVASFCVEGISVSRLSTVSMQDIRKRYAAFARLAHFASEAELAQLGEKEEKQ
ncbi:MAG: PfkB family carbohydrate kinase [Sandaracinaceae bacterium]|nr:PfkB family carbohydrate kinase [Sandaracinaceae bacterium]MDW8246482.1 PfkB family carbohydrate kinase [Sandaracinaceae bacterium]